MFKCTECERLYDIKPDYCDDCGNDSFVEIVEKIEEPIKEEKKEPETIVKNIIEEPKQTLNPKKEKPKKEIDYLSWGFLGFCIFISILIILFAFNPKEEGEIQTKTADNVIQDTKNIPSSVNGFWNNELPKVEAKKVVQAPKEIKTPENPQAPVQNVLKEIKPANIASKTPVIKNPQVVQAPKAPQQKAQAPKKQVQAQPTKVQKTATVQTQKVAPQPVKQAQPTQTKPAQTQTTKPTAQTSTQPVWQAIQQPTAKPSQTQTVDTAALKKELSNYKINLRNAIGKKIDFANVIGDGTCTVSFKIDSTGKLINRTFSQQSTNTTLNDAVYKAVMATPSYNPPPNGYKSETLRLKITFYNGNFQISLN